MLDVLGWLIFLAALMVSVMLHETGHFVAAKRFGMKCTQYFIGFAPELLITAEIRPSFQKSPMASPRLDPGSVQPGPAERLTSVTPEQALAHPTWKMGPLVTINSATLVNKGLEVIEAHLLFGFGLDQIDVVVHPQSIVHSMVEFSDGATVIMASPPDMRTPIALGLAWPDRVAGAAPGLDWTTAATWTFEPLDDSAFPAVALAREAARLGGTAPAVYNGANEACVADFLAGRISFPRIVDTVARVVSEHDPSGAGVTTVDDVLAVDDWARRRARELTRLAEA